MIDKDKIISTLTNIAYGWAGYSIWYEDSSLIVPAIACVLLMFGSGLHHYHLESWSRKWDYLGMYFVVFAILSTILGMSVIMASIFSFLGAIVLFAIPSLRENEVVVGIGMGLVLLGIAIVSPPSVALMAGTSLAVAFVFNRQGDKIHPENHDIIHGLGWHMLSALAIFIATTSLI